LAELFKLSSVNCFLVCIDAEPEFGSYEPMVRVGFDQLHRRSFGKLRMGPTNKGSLVLKISQHTHHLREVLHGTFTPPRKYSPMTKTLFYRPEEGLSLQPTINPSTLPQNAHPFSLLIGLGMGHVRPSGRAS
jgi:hypothetical protein